MDQLDQLKSIKEITEYLLIQNLENVTSFEFLSNLETILGRTVDTWVLPVYAISKMTEWLPAISMVSTEWLNPLYWLTISQLLCSTFSYDTGLNHGIWP